MEFSVSRLVRFIFIKFTLGFETEECKWRKSVEIRGWIALYIITKGVYQLNSQKWQLQWLSLVVSTFTGRFSHEPFRQRLTSAALIILFSFDSKSLTFIPIPRNKGKLIKFKPKIKWNHNCYRLRFLSHNTKKCDTHLYSPLSFCCWSGETVRELT